jgi:hypothetical protein
MVWGTPAWNDSIKGQIPANDCSGQGTTSMDCYRVATGTTRSVGWKRGVLYKSISFVFFA